MDEQGETSRNLLTEISNEIVRVFKEQFGRGPANARAAWAGPDVLTVVLESTLTAAERSLVRLGEHERLRDMRSFFQYASVRQFCDPVERLTGRTVRGFISGTVRNPATGEHVRSVAVTEEREVERKVERARRAQPDWAARPFDERAGILRAFRNRLAAEAEECARLTTREVGKPIVQSRNEVRAVLERIDWNIARVGDVIAPRSVTAGAGDAVEERVTHEPVGLVAHVSGREPELTFEFPGGR